jgi:alpha-aminoadipic semialdehyde synthase
MHFPSVPVMPGFALEGLANRNSIPYAETYKLGPTESLETIFRGTLRYRGFSALLNTMASCGMLRTRKTDRISLKHWSELGEKAMRAAQSSNVFSTAFEDTMIA